MRAGMRVRMWTGMRVRMIVGKMVLGIAKTIGEAAKSTTAEEEPPASTGKVVKIEEHLLHVEPADSTNSDGTTKAAYYCKRSS